MFLSDRLYRQDFYGVVQHFDIESAAVYEVDYPGEYFVGMLAVITDTADTECGNLPGVLVIDFSDGHVEFVADLGDYGLNNAPLTFEGKVFRQTKADFTNTDVYTHMLILATQSKWCRR
jgi:hypothetical protein